MGTDRIYIWRLRAGEAGRRRLGEEVDFGKVDRSPPSLLCRRRENGAGGSGKADQSAGREENGGKRWKRRRKRTYRCAAVDGPAVPRSTALFRTVQRVLRSHLYPLFGPSTPTSSSEQHSGKEPQQKRKRSDQDGALENLKQSLCSNSQQPSEDSHDEQKMNPLVDLLFLLDCSHRSLTSL